VNRWASALIGAALVGLAGGLAPSHAQTTPVAPTGLTAEQDHRLMLDRLGIKSLRPGVDGYNSAAPNFVNQDEAKAGPFSLLPDPLAFPDGRPVATPDDWWKRRRPELVELFSREEHGRVPKRTPAVRWRVVSEKHEVRGGVAVLERRLAGDLDNHAYPAVSVSLDLLLVTPEGRASGPWCWSSAFPTARPG
jgi:hypothetical protein